MATGSPPKTDRNKELLDLWARGDHTQTYLAVKFRISNARVHQIIQRDIQRRRKLATKSVPVKPVGETPQETI